MKCRLGDASKSPSSRHILTSPCWKHCRFPRTKSSTCQGMPRGRCHQKQRIHRSGLLLSGSSSSVHADPYRFDKSGSSWPPRLTLRAGQNEIRRSISSLASLLPRSTDGFAEDILGPQDVLVDVPHLVMRMPFLLGNNANRLKQWNKALLAQKRPVWIVGEDLPYAFGQCVIQILTLD